jgi:hypothetical protein
MKLFFIGLLSLFLVACATTSTPNRNQQLKTAVIAVQDFELRTQRLCTGAMPILSKADCEDRIKKSAVAIQAIDTARVCTVNCNELDIAALLAEQAMMRLEERVYK